LCRAPPGARQSEGVDGSTAPLQRKVGPAGTALVKIHGATQPRFVTSVSNSIGSGFECSPKNGYHD
jgi:hypothetical protein